MCGKDTAARSKAVHFNRVRLMIPPWRVAVQSAGS
jgi:hypothetical protein